MTDEDKILPVVFYRMSTGKEPVREWLKGLRRHDCRIIGEDLKTVEYGWPVGMPTCRPMGEGLYEVRSDISDGQIARVLFLSMMGISCYCMDLLKEPSRRQIKT